MQGRADVFSSAAIFTGLFGYEDAECLNTIFQDLLVMTQEDSDPGSPKTSTGCAAQAHITVGYVVSPAAICVHLTWNPDDAEKAAQAKQSVRNVGSDVSYALEHKGHAGFMKALRMLAVMADAHVMGSGRHEILMLRRSRKNSFAQKGAGRLARDGLTVDICSRKRLCTVDSRAEHTGDMRGSHAPRME